MSAVIVGSPSSGSKVLRRADFTTERNGLETLNEIYTIRTANRATLKPDFGDLHKDYSGATTKFSRMSVENFSFREQDGDLTEINVTYIGLTNSTGLPPAIVRLIPTTGAGIYGPPMVIEAEFLTDKTETQFMQDGCGGETISVGILPPLGSAVAIPSQINGTPLPRNPREPFSTQSIGASSKYHGYLQQSIASERRGIFLVVRVTFAESQSGLVATSFSPFTPGIK
jgi:hypothetical protein